MLYSGRLPAFYSLGIYGAGEVLCCCIVKPLYDLGGDFLYSDYSLKIFELEECIYFTAVIHVCLSLQDTAFVQQWFVWVYFESMGKMAPMSLIRRKEVSGEMITVLANFLMFCHKLCKRVSVLWSGFSLCLQWGFVSFMDADGF